VAIGKLTARTVGQVDDSRSRRNDPDLVGALEKPDFDKLPSRNLLIAMARA
jgi:hypothetical protein